MSASFSIDTELRSQLVDAGWTPPEPELTLEVGKVYRNRAGRLVRIVLDDGTPNYPFDDEDGNCYRPNGSYIGDNIERPTDLIEEVPTCSVGDTISIRTKNGEVMRLFLYAVGPNKVEARLVKLFGLSDIRWRNAVEVTNIDLLTAEDIEKIAGTWIIE